MLHVIGFVIDIALILLLVIFGIIGFKKGFFKSILALFSWIVCIAIAVFTAKFVAGWLNGIYDFNGLIGGFITNGLVNGNKEFFSITAGSLGSSQAVIDAIPQGTNGLLAQLIKVVFSNVEVTSETTATIGELVGTSVGSIVMLIITGILIFIILKLAIFILTKFFDNITRIRVLGGVNKIFGLLFGVVKAALIIIILNCILVGASLVPALNNTITPVIQNNTTVEKFIYNKTDEFVGKYVIEGNLIQTWIEDLWNSR